MLNDSSLSFLFCFFFCFMNHFTKLFSTLLSVVMLVSLALSFANDGIVPLSKAQASGSFSLGVEPNTDAGSGPVYYVGQTFDLQVNLDTGGADSDAANVIITYDNTLLEPVGIFQKGNIYQSYPATGNTVDGGVAKLTGFSADGSVHNGSGLFGTLEMRVIGQSSAANQYVSPTTIGFQYSAGSTTDSNIAEHETGADLLESVQSLDVYLWPDNVPPFVDSFTPSDGSASVAVDQDYGFHFRDNETGVVQSSLSIQATPNPSQTPDPLKGETTLQSNFQCEGLFGTNDCAGSLGGVINQSGDKRKWEYDTEYILVFSEGIDKASPSPNVMNRTEVSFRTSVDELAPVVRNQRPSVGGSSSGPDTDIRFDVVDLSNGVSGTGIDLDNLLVTITVNGDSTSFGPDQVSLEPLSFGDFVYGYRVTVDPDESFPENASVTVRIEGGQDRATPPNVMEPVVYSFSTSDNQGPELTFVDPTDGELFGDVDRVIRFGLADEGAGVDVDSVVVFLNGERYVCPSCEGERKFQVAGDAPTELSFELENVVFEESRSHSLRIEASDTSGNRTPVYEGSFAYFVDGETLSCTPSDASSDAGERLRDDEGMLRNAAEEDADDIDVKTEVISGQGEPGSFVMVTLPGSNKKSCAVVDENGIWKLPIIGSDAEILRMAGSYEVEEIPAGEADVDKEVVVKLSLDSVFSRYGWGMVAILGLWTLILVWKSFRKDA